MSEHPGQRASAQPRDRLRVRIAAEFAGAPAARALCSSGGLERLLASARRVEGGRSDQHLLDRDGWPVVLRIRPGRRGGWLARILGDRFASPGRVERELRLAEALAAAGLPVPRPVFAAARRHGLLWRTWLASVDHPDACDGLAFLELHGDSPRALEAARAAGCALRGLHDAGLRHGDLHLRNLLFEASRDAAGRPEMRCLLIDLDRARRGAPLAPRDRMRDWMRLVRSFEKRGRALPRRLAAAALASYCDGDRELRRAMRTRLPAERRRIALHRIGWRLARGRDKRGPGRGAVHRTLLCLWALALPLACGDARDPLPPEARQGVRASLLAVGDTGRLRPFASLLEGQRAVARGMAREVGRAPVDALVLLGDNFYTDGLTHEGLVGRLRANLVAPYCFLLRLDGPRSAAVAPACETPIAERHPVPVFAVLGNHDLEHPESAQLQREVVPDFVPEWRMSEGLAQRFALAPGVDLILFESEPSIADRDAIGDALRSAIREAPGPWRILAAHRPIATDDLGRPRLGGYPQFVRDAIVSAGRPVQLVLAAHHHNLQVFEVGEPMPSLQLGLGSGARAEPPLASADHPDARFALRSLGFARIDLQGRGRDARLVASLFETARWPILDPFVRERLVARFAVDVRGRVDRLAPITAGHRPIEGSAASVEAAAGAQALFDPLEQ